MFQHRSQKSERIDTGDYTPEEYRQFLREIAFINKYLGDRRALKKTLFREIRSRGLQEFSVLDVGSGSGELLRTIAGFARNTGRTAMLTGIDLNRISAETARSMSGQYPEVTSVQGNAFSLPFEDGAFDYAISSLFFHHLTDEQIPLVLKEMSRVARRGLFVIDLHRHPAAYVLYKLFCLAFRISPLVRHDGSLSILKGFKPGELREIALTNSPLHRIKVERLSPFRVVLRESLVPRINEDKAPHFPR